MRHEPNQLLSEVRAFALRQPPGRLFTQAEDIVPEVKRLFPITSHRCKSLDAAFAASRCTLQRLRDDKGLIFVNDDGIYKWPDTAEGDSANRVEGNNGSKAKKAVTYEDLIPNIVTYEKLTIEEWVALPEWFSQRDSSVHADKIARQPEFERDHASLGRNLAIITLNGVRYKGNGMSTTKLFLDGRAVFPNPLPLIPNYHVNDKKDGNRIYRSFDNPWSGKGAKDRLTSAFKAAGIKLTSPTFKRGKGTTGISIAYNAANGRAATSAPKPMDLDKEIKGLKASIVAVDAIGLHGGIGGSAAAVATALLSHMKILAGPESKRDAALRDWRDTWSLFMASEGSDDNPASMRHNAMWSVVLKGSHKAGGARDRVLSAVEKTLAVFHGGPAKSISLPTYLKKR